MTKRKINFKKLLLLTAANSGLAALGGTTLFDKIGLIQQDPKNAMKLAAIGAVLGSANLLISVLKEKTSGDQTKEDSDEKTLP